MATDERPARLEWIAGEDDDRGVPSSNLSPRPGPDAAGSTELKPISPELEPEVLAFVTELRRMFALLEMSLGQYARLHHRDKSGLSRYLNGTRVPPRAIIAEILTDITKTLGTPVTPEVESHLNQLHLDALAARDRRAYQVQVITDRLEDATTELRLTKRQVKDLEGELSARESVIHDLTARTRRIEHAWAGERERTDEELQQAHESYERLRAEHERLVAETAELRRRLTHAQEREARVQQRCQILEEALDAVEPGAEPDLAEDPAPDVRPAASPDGPRRGGLTGLFRRASNRWAGALDQDVLLMMRLRAPVAAHYRVAVIGLKGGVGRTTTAVGLGATLADARDDRVIAIEAGPDRGTLSDWVRQGTNATVRDLLDGRSPIRSYAEMRGFTSLGSSRLEVLAADRDPASSRAFDEADYRALADLIDPFYAVSVTDCGAGLRHSAVTGVLDLADRLVLVTSPYADSVKSTWATIAWLDAHGNGDLVRDGIVVLSDVGHRARSATEIDRLRAGFGRRCRAVVHVPYDPYLAECTDLDVGRLSRSTRNAYLTLADLVADGFGPGSTLAARGRRRRRLGSGG